MQVVILCGGKGTRIRDHHELLPKPLIPVGGRPILWHIMRYYAHFGHRRFVLCLGYRHEAFVDYFLGYRYRSNDLTIRLGRKRSVRVHPREAITDRWSVTLAETGLHTATGSRLRRAARYLRGGPFLLTYGDGVGNIDLPALLETHQRLGKLATVTAVHPAGRFGEIALEGNEVRRFAEKPQTSAGYINGGYMVLEKEFVDRYIDDDVDCVLESDALTRAARDGQMAAYCHEGFWQCMDTSREHQMLESMWESGEAPWDIDYLGPSTGPGRQASPQAHPAPAHRSSHPS